MNTVQGLELQKRMREFDEEHNKEDKSMRRIKQQDEQNLNESGEERLTIAIKDALAMYRDTTGAKIEAFYDGGFGNNRLTVSYGGRNYTVTITE